MKALLDFLAGRDWNGIANDVIAGLILLAIPVLGALAIAVWRGWKGPARWFANRAVAKFPDADRETIREDLHTEIAYGSPRAALKFAFGIWFRARDVEAAIGAQVVVEKRQLRRVHHLEMHFEWHPAIDFALTLAFVAGFWLIESGQQSDWLWVARAAMLVSLCAEVWKVIRAWKAIWRFTR
jgi:hypothetical protein